MHIRILLENNKPKEVKVMLAKDLFLRAWQKKKKSKVPLLAKNGGMCTTIEWQQTFVYDTQNT